MRNKYYHLDQRGMKREEMKILLRVMTIGIKMEIRNYKAT